jgi:hypothetical protein
MRKYLLCLLLVAFTGQFISCTPASPEQYFAIAVLNCNMMHGFAGNGALQRELESPSVKMVAGDKNKVEPMKRKEIIDSRIQTLEANHDKVKKLKETTDTRDMLQASDALYSFVVPVYKNEYQQLAKMYDENASSELIRSYTQSITDKYYPQFEQLYQKLVATGKSYAEKHKINVQWDVQTSPR